MSIRKRLDGAFPEISRPDGGPASADTKEAILRDMLGVEAQKWRTEILEARSLLAKQQNLTANAERAVAAMREVVRDARECVAETQRELIATRRELESRPESLRLRIMRKLGLV